MWSENVIEFLSTGRVRETKLWVDGVPIIRTMLSGTDKFLAPASDGDVHLGASYARWSDVYAASGVINTSDRNEKQDIQPIPDAVLDAWASVQYRMFRFKDAVAKKGDGARLHIGLVAQDIEEAFRRRGLDAFAYGLLCRDEVNDEKNGSRREIWGIRPDECQFLESALQRREWNRKGKQASE
ncbi:tail fiber domain-containing protein [Paenibacillus ginsengarvi]|uniref:Tail fiber domain-containing protein n=1 Tax=Paenibacillus ginsengarvi TaxID=400777 RepID=A0A3B0CL31_9BACL|nr:tail fiber domain-containing protein [Paenibacillus ginsengarvi]RKN86375.1 tail fiber domain-containing protein [Paenibacillus ginsengarvi]